MATHGLSCTAWRQRPTLRSRARRGWKWIVNTWQAHGQWPPIQRITAWAVVAWCVIGWVFVIPAWLYLRGGQ